MEATVFWRRIGGWVVELRQNGDVMPILHLVKTDELQQQLATIWPNCEVTHNPLGVAEIVIREVPYEGVAQLVNSLARTYPTHPITGEHIRWTVSPEVIG